MLERWKTSTGRHGEESMLKNLTVVLENRPGALAGACEVIGQAGINIGGLCCFASQGVAMLYVAVEDGAAARRALERAGLKVSEERDIAEVPVQDRPGGAGKALRRIADAGINLELAYQGIGKRIIVVTNDAEKVRRLLHE
jgi:hypothetical protein